ncbi:hypothetical protein SADUNF_Sadunf06G0210000 [Salix dunnii]|uniref:Transmembrane protein n=1 Tax=Salix dunnii TaxID=1413687 RepID=A0A835K004_9ROSI|nr:hypothetical protein SADUNF_Sadunf06G0210000 [Salix dunnii]
MVTILKKPLFLMSKSTLLLILILVAIVTLVIVARRPKFRASSMNFPQSNRLVQPSGPNPCSYVPGSGHCKPPKRCTRSLLVTGMEIF